MLHTLLALVKEVLILKCRLVSEKLQDLEVAFEFIAQFMLKHLDLEELETHALWELGLNAL